MHDNDTDIADLRQKWHGSLMAYMIGLLLSVLLTLIAYFAVVKHVFTDPFLSYFVVGLALLQAAAQLLFFLHVAKESRPHWNFLVFCLMVLVLLIVVLGSLWIMFDLDARMMPKM